jgi:hypothetical protein
MKKKDLGTAGVRSLLLQINFQFVLPEHEVPNTREAGICFFIQLVPFHFFYLFFFFLLDIPPFSNAH